MKIVVTTPTGNVGAHIVPLLVQAGERPTLLVRDAARLAAEVREATEVVELDLSDRDAVVEATEGADALYWVDPPTDDDDPAEGYARIGAVGAHAVRVNGIARVVFQSSVGAEARHGFGEIDGLARTEQSFDETGASVTHLRCGYFFTNLLMDVESLRSGILTTTLPLDYRMPWVAPRDIGAVAAARLLSTSWQGRHTQGVHGPADLSFSEAAAIVGHAIGREIRAMRISDEEAAASLREVGLGDLRIDRILGMARGFRGDFHPENPRSLATTTPTTLAQWAYDALRAYRNTP